MVKGEAIGLSREKFETFPRQTRIRFRAVPATRADEALSADAATLNRCLDALTVADTLKEVLEPHKGITDRRWANGSDCGCGSNPSPGFLLTLNPKSSTATSFVHFPSF